MAHHWYAIQSFGGSEQAVKRGIIALVERLGVKEKLKDVVVPTEDVIEIKNGKKKITERCLYSGYVFAQLDLDTELWHAIQTLPKVGGFIGEQKKPTQLSEKDINTILEKMEKREAPKPKISFDVGETVRITEGSFANFTGVVEEYDMEHGRLKLNVSIFGRRTPVDILYSQVEKIV